MLYLKVRDEYETSMHQRANMRINRYWQSPPYRKAFKAIGFTVPVTTGLHKKKAHVHKKDKEKKSKSQEDPKTATVVQAKATIIQP